jgi:hypothetical protein
VTEPSPHLDLDALADALAGESDGEPHLSSCASCTSRLAELEAAEARVVSVLSSLPPPQLPPDLADRLTAALAAEAPLRPAGSSGVTTLAARRPRRSWLPAAAAAVLVLAGGGLGVALVKGGTGGGADTAATSAADDSGGRAGLLLNSSGTDWSDTDAVTAVLPAVLQGEAGEARLLDTGAGNAGSAEAPAAAAEGADQARAEDQDATTFATGPQVAAAPADPLALLRTPEGLASCLAGVLAGEPDTTPLALDYAQFAGQPALAVLLPDPDPSVVSAFLVGPGCSQADANVLHFVRVPRP